MGNLLTVTGDSEKFAGKFVSAWGRVTSTVYTEKEKSNGGRKGVKWELEWGFACCKYTVVESSERVTLGIFVTAGQPAAFHPQKVVLMSEPCFPGEFLNLFFNFSWWILNAEQGCERNACEEILLIEKMVRQ